MLSGGLLARPWPPPMVLAKSAAPVAATAGFRVEVLVLVSRCLQLLSDRRFAGGESRRPENHTQQISKNKKRVFHIEQEEPQEIKGVESDVKKTN